VAEDARRELYLCERVLIVLRGAPSLTSRDQRRVNRWWQEFLSASLSFQHTLEPRILLHHVDSFSD
jgi:hypothetical protein